MNAKKVNSLLSTKERVKTLKYVIYLEKPFTVTQISRELELNKGFISNYFKLLREQNILKRRGNEFTAKGSTATKSLRIMFNLQKVNGKIFGKYEFVEAVGMYGSMVKGTNTISSDADIWIKIKHASAEEQSELTAELRENLENIKPLILNDEKVKEIKKQDPMFYYSLYFGSIPIYGEINEIRS